MSTLKVTNIESPSGGGVNAKITDINGGQLSNRNLIINGAMQISQRGTSHSFAHDGLTGGYTLDRMSFVTANTESFDCTVTQDTDAPDGFAKSWKLTTGTAEASIDADDLVYFQTLLEAQNLQQLDYGAVGAKTITLSFYVKSSVSGTFGVTIYQADAVRNRTSTYTINATDTWERKTITFTGDTSGTINDDNGVGFNVAWNLAAGSNWDTIDSTAWGAYVTGRWAFGHAQDDVITTASATWQITGMQLEVGDVATTFEHRSAGDELARCQRYYYKLTADTGDTFCNGYNQNTRYTRNILHFPVTMRAAPTALEQTGTAANYRIMIGTSQVACSGVPTLNSSTTNTGEVQADTGSGLTAGQGNALESNSNGTYLAFAAELV